MININIGLLVVIIWILLIIVWFFGFLVGRGFRLFNRSQETMTPSIRMEIKNTLDVEKELRKAVQDFKPPSLKDVIK